MSSFGHIFRVLSGSDEAVGRAMVATLAWGIACEALGHAHGIAEMDPSELSLARADAARTEVRRTREVFNEALTAIGLGPFLADEERETDLSLLARGLS
jgi:hypothetical protein